jgi:hypothetical protein
MQNNLLKRENLTDDIIAMDKIDNEIPLYSFICNYCKNFIDYRECKAFDLIPLEIWGGKNPHTEPFEGDKGILFEKRVKK